MSEFSDCYYLRSDNQLDGVDLLRRAKLQGFVYPSENHWVTILPEGPMFAPNENLIKANTAILLHYCYAEDHGWDASLYDASLEIFSYECVWDDDWEVDDSDDVEIPELLNLLATDDPTKNDQLAENIQRFFHPEDEDDI